MKFIAQPFYDAMQVKIFSLPAAAHVATIDLVCPGPGPNAVVLYHDPSTATVRMFVSFDFNGSTGAVDLYTFDPLTLTAAFDKTIGPLGPAAGMAIQPGTGDLFVATASVGGDDGGVLQFSSSDGYSTQTQFASFNTGGNCVARICANLAFDPQDRLWMTTFDNDGQFLICFTPVTPDAATENHFVKFLNRTSGASDMIVTLPDSAPAPASMFLLSQPEGIAFDPLGNLWFTTNDDDFPKNGGSNGTVVMIARDTLDQAIGGAFTAMANALSQPRPDMPPLVLPASEGYGDGSAQIFPNSTIYYRSGARFGGLFFDGFTLYVNDQSNQNAPGFDASNAVVWKFQTDDTSSFLPSGVTTKYPGNGTMSIFLDTPPTLLIRDAAGDTGLEPETAAGGFLWESPDIGLTNFHIGNRPPPNSVSPTALNIASDQTIFNFSAFVYVRVANTGTVPVSGTEILKVYWANASTGLSWPAPWDGSVVDPAHPTVPLGGLIGARVLGPIDPGHETIFEIPWPDVLDIAKRSNRQTHFCLLARVETTSLYPFGMTFPEQVAAAGQTVLETNVASNSKIAWRNVTILPPVPQHPGPFGGRPAVPFNILASNYATLNSRFGFAILAANELGRPIKLSGVVHLKAEGTALQRMLAAKFQEDHVRFQGEGVFHVLNPADGVQHVLLEPGDVLPFIVEYTPAEEEQNFAVRVVQYTLEHGKKHIVGGQTFIVGKVNGFPVHEQRY